MHPRLTCNTLHFRVASAVIAPPCISFVLTATSQVWEELGPKWPDGFWDDWLREPPQRKGRQFLRPHVSRTFTFGEEGVSAAQFYSQYLGNIKLNAAPVDWSRVDLSYLDKVCERSGSATHVAPSFLPLVLHTPLQVGV